MLELQHISYETEENREILHDISLTIQDRFVAKCKAVGEILHKKGAKQ